MKLVNTPAPLLAAGIGIVMLSGVAVTADAAAKSPGYVACANSNDRLALVTHGHCASGFHKVSLGARGVTGKAGPSDVYVAVSTLSPTARTPTLKLPAGRYLVAWSATVTGSLAPVDDNDPYSVEEFCYPILEAKVELEGPPAGALAPLVKFPPSSPDDPASFAAHVTASGEWAVNAGPKGGTLKIRCTDPSVVDVEGSATSLDIVHTTGQLTATKTASIHGSDTYLP